MSLCRQNYHEECEAGINTQINLTLYAEYVARSVAFHFQRDDIGLPKATTYFLQLADFLQQQAQTLLEYQNRRGGRIVLNDIKKPERDEWGTLLESLQIALDLAKHINQSLLDLHVVAEKHGDVEMSYHIQARHLKILTSIIYSLASQVTNGKRVGPGLGEYEMEKLLSWEGALSA